MKFSNFGPLTKGRNKLKLNFKDLLKLHKILYFECYKMDVLQYFGFPCLNQLISNRAVDGSHIHSK